MTREEFANYFLYKHLETTRNMHWIKGYRVNIALSDDELAGLPGMVFSPMGKKWGYTSGRWDCSYESWYEDIDALKASLSSDDADLAVADDHNFIDTDGVECFITKEHIVSVPDYRLHVPRQDLRNG